MIGIFSGSVVQKMNFTCSGGSSSVFSSALKAACGQHVDFVDDVDLVSTTTGANPNIGSQRSNFIDPTIAGTVDFDHVNIFARIDRLGDVGGIVGVAVGPPGSFSALAKIRAVLVLPTPRAPVNRYACPTRLVSIAFFNARPTCS